MLKRWLLAVCYLGLCSVLLFLLPTWLRIPVLAAWGGYVVWTLLTMERDYGRAKDLRPLTRWDVPGDPAFRERLRTACQELGLSREPIWAVVDDDQVNAMALWGPRGYVVFTTGLLRQLGPDELLAVAGHELRHLRTRDSLPALLGTSWLTLLGWLSGILRGTATALAQSNTMASILTPFLHLLVLVLDVALYVVGWVASAVLASRSRHDEHMADLAGARLTSVGSMIAALERLEESAMKPPHGELAKWSREWVVERLHASHPPLTARVAFLNAAAERGEIHV